MTGAGPRFRALKPSTTVTQDKQDPAADQKPNAVSGGPQTAQDPEPQNVVKSKSARIVMIPTY